MSGASADGVYAEVRELAARDPRDAREHFCRLLDGDAPDLEEVLRLAAAPGEGRVRQLIANSVRTRPDKTRLVPHLISWLKDETDEFAKKAIVAALENVDLRSLGGAQESPIADMQLVDTYRYVRDRLCHELRNALMRPRAHVIRLRDALGDLGDPELRGRLRESIGQLDDALQSVGRIVELDCGDDFFTIRPIQICEWLTAMNADYASKFTALALTLDGPGSRLGLRVLGSDYLLRTIFWNLWMNAQQAVGGDCRLRVTVVAQGGLAKLVVSDNGAGFSKDFAEVLFRERYSSKGTHRGEGLLQVLDAAQRLRGRASLVADPSGAYRVSIELPIS